MIWRIKNTFKTCCNTIESYELGIPTNFYYELYDVFDYGFSKTKKIAQMFYK